MLRIQSNPNYSYSGKDVLITGGTGSLGTSLIKHFCSLPESTRPNRVVCLSRDWKDQEKLRAAVPSKSLRTFIGDIRDLDRLFMAFRGIDYVFHTAAIKSIVDCEYNPMEAILTNVVGTWNVIRAAIDAKVERVEFISSDKSSSPINTYGKSKALAESLIIASGSYAPQTKFFAARYGNVLGSNGSVLPIFLNQAKLFTEGDEFSFARDPFVVHEIKLGLFERGGDFVFDHLYSDSAPHYFITLFYLSDSSYI